MFRKMLLVGLLFLANFVHAQDLEKCSDIYRDRERAECVYAQFKKADVALNMAYKDFQKSLESEATEVKELLKRAQRAWLSYRDLDCELESKPFTGGTLLDEIVSRCLIKKTILRTEELISLRVNPY